MREPSCGSTLVTTSATSGTTELVQTNQESYPALAPSTAMPSHGGGTKSVDDFPRSARILVRGWVVVGAAEPIEESGWDRHPGSGARGRLHPIPGFSITIPSIVPSYERTSIRVFRVSRRKMALREGTARRHYRTCYSVGTRDRRLSGTKNGSENDGRVTPGPQTVGSTP